MMSSRFELFCREPGRSLDFYVGCLGFRIEYDARPEFDFVTVRRDAVAISLAATQDEVYLDARRPPTGVELILEVDDLGAERERLVEHGWPLDTDVTERHWGQSDLRVIDPAGYYLRITGR